SPAPTTNRAQRAVSKAAGPMRAALPPSGSLPVGEAPGGRPFAPSDSEVPLGSAIGMVVILLVVFVVVLVELLAAPSSAVDVAAQTGLAILGHVTGTAHGPPIVVSRTAALARKLNTDTDQNPRPPTESARFHHGLRVAPQERRSRAKPPPSAPLR